MTENGNENELEQISGFVEEVTGKQVQFERGFALRVSAEQDVTMTQARAVAVGSGRDITLTNGRCVVSGCGRDLKVSNSALVHTSVGHGVEMENSAAVLLRTAGNVTLTDSAVVSARANQVTAQGSTLGVVLARQVELGEGSRVILNTPQAAALGAAAGAVFALLSWLLKRK